MKILVSCAVLPDLEALASEDWHADEQKQINTAFAPLDWNACDESALELSLRLSAQDGKEPVERCAMTIGPKNRERFLKTLAALRFDRLIRIDDDGADLRFAPQAVAQIIAETAREEQADVILTGRQNPIGENAMTPLLVAELLHIPCLTQVMQMEWLDEKEIRVVCRVDGGLRTYCVKTPCVLSVGDVPGTYLRVPTLKDKMKYGKLPIAQKTIHDFPQAVHCLEEAACQLEDLRPVIQEREGKRIPGETMEEMVHNLMETVLKGRLIQE
ncbi:MAG: electron transfer flavoprotein subunit beta/FixA family protein [Eubacteriales bacterium]|nr:electron transfer flavoprotein subunit beta/FixA family protein [Eubacteriales bacterium]